MNRNNDVFQVLVTKDLAPLAAGAALETLAVGQLGAFDPKTNLSIDSTTSPMPNEFYLAVGRNTTGAGGGATLEDIRQSAGQSITRAGIGAYTYANYTAGAPMRIIVSGLQLATVDTDYGIRLEFRNSRIYRIQGYNQFSKAFVVRSAASPDGIITTVDGNAVIKQLVDNIAQDTTGLVTATYNCKVAISGATATAITAAALAAGLTANAGGVITVTAKAASTAAAPVALSDDDIRAIIAYNATVAAGSKIYADLLLTSNPIKIGQWLGINLGYHKLLQTTILASLISGFTSSTTEVVSQYPVYAEGNSDNIMQKEYHAAGWAGSGPYVLSEVTGTAKGNIVYMAVAGTNYDQFVIEYANTSESGWRSYKNALSTIVAIPTTASANKTALVTFLDALVGGLGFDTMASDVSTPPTDADGDGSTEPTSANTDGIG